MDKASKTTKPPQPSERFPWTMEKSAMASMAPTGNSHRLSLVNGQLHNSSIGRLTASGAHAHLTKDGASATIDSASIEAAQQPTTASESDSGQIERAGISTTDTNWQDALKDNRFANSWRLFLNGARFSGVSSESDLGRANVSSAKVNGASFEASRETILCQQKKPN